MRFDFETYKSQIRDLRKDYDALCGEFEETIPLDNKILQDCLKNQITMQMKFNELYSELYHWHENAKTDVEELYSLRYQVLIDDSYKGYSATEAKQIAMSDTNYLQMKRIYNNFHALLSSMNELNDLLETRKYTLKTISDSMINGINKHII